MFLFYYPNMYKEIFLKNYVIMYHCISMSYDVFLICTDFKPTKQTLSKNQLTSSHGQL